MWSFQIRGGKKLTFWRNFWKDWRQTTVNNNSSCLYLPSHHTELTICWDRNPYTLIHQLTHRKTWTFELNWLPNPEKNTGLCSLQNNINHVLRNTYSNWLARVNTEQRFNPSNICQRLLRKLNKLEHVWSARVRRLTKTNLISVLFRCHVM